MTREKFNREVIFSSIEPTSCITLIYNDSYLPIEAIYPKEIFIERSKGKIAQLMLFQGSKSIKDMIILIKKIHNRVIELNIDKVFIAIDPEEQKRYTPFNFKNTNWTIKKWPFADYAEVCVMYVDCQKSIKSKIFNFNA